MPTIFELLDRFSFMQGYPAAYGVLLTAVIIFMIHEWRLTLFALSLQYIIAGLLFVEVLDPRLASVKVLTGLFVCLILAITGRPRHGNRLLEDVTEAEAAWLRRVRGIGAGKEVRISAALLRLFVTAMMVLAVWTLAQRPEIRLPAVGGELGHMKLAIFTLAGMGLLGAAWTSDPLRSGVGVLMFLSGFELYYYALEQSVAMLFSLAAVNFVVALVIAYLTQAYYQVTDLIEDQESSLERS